MKEAKALVYTSFDDCKSGLYAYLYADLPVLEEALELARSLGHKSRVKLLDAKIKKLKQAAIQRCAEFAEQFPIGTPVHYFPVIGQPKFRVFVIRSMPWILASGELMVKAKGITGGVSCAAIKAIPQEVVDGA